MSNLFWIAVAALIGIAMLFIVPPLWRRNELAESEVDQRNINIARQRLKELKRLLEEGALTQAQFDEQYQELELTLSDELDSLKQISAPSSQGKWIIPVVVLFVPLLSLSLYFSLGDTQAQVKAEQQQLARQQQEKAQQTIDKMVAGLAERLKQQPDDAEGWLMLGRSLKYMQQYDKAAEAFAQAYRLLGDEVSVMLYYADALAMARGGRLAGKPAELIFKALALSPDDATGLWLGGMAKAEAGEFAQALQYWQKLEPLLPKDSPSRRELQGMMAALKSRLNETTEPAEAAPAVNIAVSVRLSESLRQQAQADDVVFVYAQALNGPKMPLAIVRKSVADLPLSVQLNDAMAMTPAMKLSAFSRVKVIARVSGSGNAMPQAGDLIGQAEVAELGPNSSVAITIDRRVE
ncbi:c-type cytochrome biogenesis protein CcmI [Methylomarinum sp. Ch1-1]|uniref:C-type cytochrome biogenesis protein CcmI n=1 Tax=Methylomarinum roseum TaxID=3067653 RepID=A0AAU7NR60_9GAMM|nr:c-type cytochrome biogenesis protein CcmI [Methylomarinum sp. Ch1-1]MDP4520551.1 c-type cytochrome biogenesis protein CcmI [Methylomarinum sp. Ch1-1]